MLKEYIKPNKKWILTDENELLHKVCKDVVFPLTPEDESNINKLVSYIDTCYESEKDECPVEVGLAIAAPQIGYLKNIIYMNFDDDGKHVNYLLINPKIISHSLTKCYFAAGEVCLSVKQEHKGHVLRHHKVIVRAYNLLLKQDQEITFEGLSAICIQHEMDHLIGKLFYERINQNDPYY